MKYVFAIFVLLCVVCHAIEEEIGLYPPTLASKEEWSRRVYLASYPRSGNHWVRYLIEEVTDIATSSVYCDVDLGKSHLDTPFPWGGYCPKNGYAGKCRYPTPDDIVVVKTHFPALQKQEFDGLPCARVVRIVRHPVDSLYSFYLFERKKNFNPRMRRKFFGEQLKLWKNFHEYWNKQANTVTVRYEDLLERPHEILQTILGAIGYDVSDEKIDRAIQKYPPKGHPMKHMRFFEPENLALIKYELGDLMKQFNYTLP